MATETTKIKKKQQLRNNEYYNMQEVFDNLYERSLKGQEFKDLMSLIKREENILLAYRNIKKNKGSKTKGVNDTTIVNIREDKQNTLIKRVRGRLDNYTPHPVRRVEIEKEDGKKRPLGIPTMEDRLLQQCIKQTIEPICEAKFNKHSYGFRPNRKTHNAIARALQLININGLHYAVDIDIKGFFDNVNHGKLLKQVWSMGIKDKNLLSIISKLLKAEIKGEGIPTKGTPQGGIISPLLSNVVLNELDWWISSQWQNMKTRYPYKEIGSKIRALKKNTKLKEMYIVRYCDDFKIFCRSYETAQKTYIAVKKWLKERLSLQINSKKSSVTNLRKNYTNFLGFKLKVRIKGKKRVAKSHISDKAKTKIIKKIKEKIKELKKNQTANTANKYNAMILGMHNYYRYATNVNLDFSEIAFLVRKSLYNSTKGIRSETGYKSKAYMKFYGKYNFRLAYVGGIALYPIAGITMKIARKFQPLICNYTEKGRLYIHANLKYNYNYIIQHLLKQPVKSQSVEYNDNRISLYIGQQGKCSVTGEILEIGKMEVHHKKPRSLGGKDDYNNLTLVKKDIHKLIHVKVKETVDYYKGKITLNKIGLEKLNKLRLKVGNCVI